MWMEHGARGWPRGDLAGARHDPLRDAGGGKTRRRGSLERRGQPGGVRLARCSWTRTARRAGGGVARPRRRGDTAWQGELLPWRCTETTSAPARRSGGGPRGQGAAASIRCGSSALRSSERARRGCKKGTRGWWRTWGRNSEGTSSAYIRRPLGRQGSWASAPIDVMAARRGVHPRARVGGAASEDSGRERGWHWVASSAVRGTRRGSTGSAASIMALEAARGRMDKRRRRC